MVHKRKKEMKVYFDVVDKPLRKGSIVYITGKPKRALGQGEACEVLDIKKNKVKLKSLEMLAEDFDPKKDIFWVKNLGEF